MSDNDSAPPASRRPEMTTFAPCSAKATAVALPIPEVPPVINTTFSANDVFIEECKSHAKQTCASVPYAHTMADRSPHLPLLVTSTGDAKTERCSMKIFGNR